MGETKVSRWAWNVGLGLWLVGCAPAATFTKRGNACAVRDRCCQVTLVDGRAPRPYQVIGVIDIEAFAVRSIPDQEEAFLALVRGAVCNAGGDGVIPGINGDGRYVQATVVKWTAPGAVAPVCASPENEGAGGAKQAEPGQAERDPDEASSSPSSRAPGSAGACIERTGVLRRGMPC